MSQNAFELDARATKTAKLVAAIDAETEGVTPLDVARRLTEFTDRDWRRIASAAGANPPSRTTQAQVIARYLTRANETDDTAPEEHPC